MTITCFMRSDASASFAFAERERRFTEVVDAAFQRPALTAREEV